MSGIFLQSPVAWWDKLIIVISRCHVVYRLEKILGHLSFSRKFYSTREERLQAAIIVARATGFYYHMFLLYISIYGRPSYLIPFSINSPSFINRTVFLFLFNLHIYLINSHLNYLANIKKWIDYGTLFLYSAYFEIYLFMYVDTLHFDFKYVLKIIQNWIRRQLEFQIIYLILFFLKKYFLL